MTTNFPPLGTITFEVEYRSSNHLPWTRFEFVASKRAKPEGLGAMKLELERLRNEFPTCTFQLLRVEIVG